MIESGTWHQLVFNYKLAFDDFGYIRSWMDGEILTEFNGVDNKFYGPNMHNKAQPYLKMGLYRYWEDSNRHAIYFDNLRIGKIEDEFFEYDQTKKPSDLQ